jgi:hypothetical protein
MMHQRQPGTVSSMTAYPAHARASSPTAALFGAVMALVALTVGFATLGVYLGRDSEARPGLLRGCCRSAV